MWFFNTANVYTVIFYVAVASTMICGLMMFVSELLLYFLYSFFFYFYDSPVAYERFQARGRIGAATAGLYHNRRNAGFELHL